MQSLISDFLKERVTFIYSLQSIATDIRGKRYEYIFIDNVVLNEYQFRQLQNAADCNGALMVILNATLREYDRISTRA